MGSKRSAVLPTHPWTLLFRQESSMFDLDLDGPTCGPFFESLKTDICGTEIEESDQMKRHSYYWCFTLNNPTVERLDWKGVKYMVYQKEKGESGTVHFQGYVEFDCKKRIKALKKIEPGAHWEARKGTAEQAIVYVTKEDTRIDGPWHVGTPPVAVEPGKRNDLVEFRKAVGAGKRKRELMDDPNFIPIFARHPRFYNTCLESEPERTENTSCHIYWGVTGAGKTTRVNTLYPGAFWLTPPRNSKNGVWWDGYDGQETVVIDEFKGWIPQHMLRRLLDKVPLRVETKGGSVEFVSKRLVLISNFAPESWYKGGMSDALRRRVTEVKQFTEKHDQCELDVTPLDDFNVDLGPEPYKYAVTEL